MDEQPTIEVLDVKIDASGLRLVLHALLLVTLPQFLVTLRPLLGATDKNALALEVSIVELIACLPRRLVADIVDETETERRSEDVRHQFARLTLCRSRHRSFQARPR